MATLSPPFGIRSSGLNRYTVEASKIGRYANFSHKNKFLSISGMMDTDRKEFCGGSERKAREGAKRGLKSFGIAAARVSVEQDEPVITSLQVDELKKRSTYLFRTKSDALVRVYVSKQITTHVVEIIVSSLQLDSDDSMLVMLWGTYRSDSSGLLAPEFPNLAEEDSQTQITETPFLRNSICDYKVQLEFEGKEPPFYLFFVLKSFTKVHPSGEVVKSHRDTNFVIPVGFGAGRPWPLGFSFAKDGSFNFAFFTRQSKGVVLCLFSDNSTEKPALELDLDPYINRTGDVWHASIDGAYNFLSYGYRCRETLLQEDGENVNTQQIVLDPYAKIIRKFASDKFLGRLSKEPDFDWGDETALNIPLEELAVYRLNVARFTQHNSSKLPADMAGTFSGLAEKVHHLKNLGMNGVLLEPIFTFDEKKGPYFPFHFFAPIYSYGPSNDSTSAITSMKEMVKKFHDNGMEVFLEVVFTHTADSGALQGIDDRSYYFKNRVVDTEMKNFLNCNYPIVQQLVLESLHYWVTQFHIDGFCFINASSLQRGFHGESLSRPPLVEAIAFDPLLSNTKIIADCWDPQDITPKETRFPHWKRWAEINSRFCFDIRNFLRGKGVLSDLATRLCGSGDIFTGGRGPAFSFNYIARNSGFPLVDLVSFSDEEAVSELSWNCGEEGPTNKSPVLERRLKQIRNFLFILFISLGIPVLNMGDECGISTGGSPSYQSRKPLDWTLLDSAFGTQITQFISFMSSFRNRRRDIFQRRDFLKPENIEWYGNDLSSPKWDDPDSKFLAVAWKAEEGEREEDDKKDQSLDEQVRLKGNLFIAVNASENSVNVVVPVVPDGMMWRRIIDTGLPFPGFFSVSGVAVPEELTGLVVYEMKSYSCILFESFNLEES